MTSEHSTGGYCNRIITHPDLLAGKPTIKGTRIWVDLVLKRLSQNLDVVALFEAVLRDHADDLTNQRFLEVTAETITRLT